MEKTSEKISPQFAARLDRLDRHAKIQAIVLLQSESAIDTTKRPSRSDRQAAMKAIRESAAQSLTKINAILEEFNGKLLADSPDLLGSIPIEIEVAGIKTLAESTSVKALLENQKIHQIE
ncbi:MAG: hypothetical protein AAGA60_21835 [Cyanobacteria bacterium P01_E01_bin.42]